MAIADASWGPDSSGDEKHARVMAFSRQTHASAQSPLPTVASRRSVGGVDQIDGRRPATSTRTAAWVFAAALLVACGGASDSPSNEDPQGGSHAGNGARGGSGGSGGSYASEASCGDPYAQKRAVRLTSQQLRNTIAHTYGLTIADDDLPPDPYTGDGVVSFSTYASGLTVTSAHLDAYRKIAARVVDDELPKWKTETACVLTTAADDGCVDGFVRAQGRRAFRRPLTLDEISRYRALFRDVSGKAGAAATDGPRAVVTAMLLAPAYLYRTELGDQVDNGTVQLTPHEVADAIAYTLTDAPADDELTKAAEAGRLGSDDERRAHAQRLANSDAGRAKLADLFRQLYGLDALERANKDAKAFPSFTAELRADMLEESRALVARALLEHHGELGAVFGADDARVTGRLARHYGLDASLADGESGWVKLPEPRRGLLATGSIVAGHSPSDHTSPSQRGLLVLTSLLCGAVPTPPDGAQDQPGKIFDATKPDDTQREHWVYAVKTSPECAACHRAFVPYGLGLEQYDPVGRLRDTEFGKKIDPEVEVANVDPAVDGKHRDTPAFASALVKSPTGARCFTRHARGYLLGDLPGETDACRNESLAESFRKEGLSVQSLAVEMVARPSFVRRSP